MGAVTRCESLIEEQSLSIAAPTKTVMIGTPFGEH
jgi:hypothetical protein